MKISLGYLRQDDDGHWYLIPENLIIDFDYLMQEVESANNPENIWSVIDKNFYQYRTEGGIEDVQCLIPPSKEDNDG